MKYKKTMAVLSLSAALSYYFLFLRNEPIVPEIVSLFRRIPSEARSSVAPRIRDDAPEPAEDSSGFDSVVLSEFDEIVEGPPTPEVHNHWFVKPNMQAGREYLKPPDLKISWGKSCAGRIPPYSTMFDLIEKKFGHSVTAQFPKDIRVTQFSLFWKLDDFYHQASAFLQPGQRKYDLVHYEGKSADLSRDVEPRKIDNFDNGTLVDQVAAMNILENMLATYVARGAKEGARVMEVELISSVREESATISYINASPLAYLDGELACRTMRNLTSAKCACSDPNPREGKK